MSKLYGLLIGLLGILVSINIGYAQESETAKKSFSLEEAQAYALKNNLNLKVNAYNIDAAKGQVTEIQAIGLPQVNGSVNVLHNLQLPVTLVPGVAFGQPDQEFVELTFGTENNINAKIEATQLLFDGSYFLGLKAARLFVERAKLQQVQTELDMRATIAEAYFGALVAQENVEIFEKNIEVIEKTLFETTEIYKNGFAEKLDVDRLQLSLSNLKSQLDNALRMQELAENLLKFQMGLDLEEAIELSDKLDSFIAGVEDVFLNDPKILQDKAMSNRIELALLDMQNTFRVLDIKQVRMQYFPSVVAFFQAQSSFQSNDFKIFDQSWINSSAIGLSINIPIFDGLQKKGQVQQRLISQQQAFKQEALVKESIRLEVLQNQTGYINALDQIKYQKKNLALAEEIYQTTLTKYKEGLGSSFEVTAAEGELYKTQGQYLQALYQLILTKNSMSKSLGTGNYKYK